MPYHDRNARPSPEPASAYCTLGPHLCRVRVWTEDEWDARADTPAAAEHIPGIGWIVALPVETLN